MPLTSFFGTFSDFRGSVFQCAHSREATFSLGKTQVRVYYGLARTNRIWEPNPTEIDTNMLPELSQNPPNMIPKVIEMEPWGGAPVGSRGAFSVILGAKWRPQGSQNEDKIVP